MIKKVISGGQTGADRAALDVAIRQGVPHAGWIPKGLKAEDGTVPDKYNLREMPTSSYPKRTEQNVLDSDGTLILTHGKLTGGSKLTQDCARKHGRPCLHINLIETPSSEIVSKIVNWILENNIEVLNIAGSRASKDPKIYEKTFKIVSCVYWSCKIKSGEHDFTEKPSFKPEPKTVSEAVNHLVNELPLKDKAGIANMTESELGQLHYSLGIAIRNATGLWTGNRNLLDSCQSVSSTNDLNDDEAACVMIKELWEILRQTHKLRAVK